MGMFCFTTGQAFSVERAAFIPGALGLTNYDEMTIKVSRFLDGIDELDTFIHEWMHCEFPTWRELRVEAISSTLAAPIWAAGARVRCDIGEQNEVQQKMRDAVDLGLYGARSVARLLLRSDETEARLAGLSHCLTNFLTHVGYGVECEEEEHQKVGFKVEAVSEKEEEE